MEDKQYENSTEVSHLHNFDRLILKLRKRCSQKKKKNIARIACLVQ